MDRHSSAKNFFYSHLNPRFLIKRVLVEEIARNWKTFNRPERGVAKRINDNLKLFNSLPFVLFGLPMFFMFSTGAIFMTTSYSAIAGRLAYAGVFTTLFIDLAKVKYAYYYYEKEINTIQVKYNFKVETPYVKS